MIKQNSFVFIDGKVPLSKTLDIASQVKLNPGQVQLFAYTKTYQYFT